MRRTDIQRDSRPASHQLFSNQDEKAALEARNGLANRQPYYEALDAADAAWSNNTIDLSAMEALLEHALAIQLSSVLEAAGSSE